MTDNKSMIIVCEKFFKQRVALLFLLSPLFFSCGTDSKHFKIDGRFLHLNRGEFYVYSPDGVINGIDTIRVEAGRFRYEVACEQEGTLIMVFPNFSEQPIFVKPGESVDIKGDASHLKEMTVTGTDDNQLMNAFRKQIAEASPPETTKAAAQFIENNTTSPVSVYLLSRYFLQAPFTDYAAAARLSDILVKQQPHNGYVARLSQQAHALKNSVKGRPLPIVKATDINGNSVSTASLKDTQTAVILLWASWNHDSINMLRLLKQLSRKSHGNLKVFTVCIDAGRNECLKTIERDSINWPTVCDGQMLESPTVRQLGLSSVPDNLIIRNGRITEHSLNYDQLRKAIEEKL